MTDQEREDMWMGLVVGIAGLSLVVGLMVGCIFQGRVEGRVQMKEEALKAGVAEWYLDENSNKQFRYKECK